MGTRKREQLEQKLARRRESSRLAEVAERRTLLEAQERRQVDLLVELDSRCRVLEWQVRDRDRLVGKARAAGVSWARIGRVLGVSAQAVQKRYGKDDESE